MIRTAIAAFVAAVFTAAWLLAVGTIAIGAAHMGWPVPTVEVVIMGGLAIFSIVFWRAHAQTRGRI